ncbi:MAG: lipid-A-disaccharide synthase, partial [Bernardetiaceae bacterium]|nr:lipid-A-disaccharide synthase [Bernardetiaceae bacterium]
SRKQELREMLPTMVQMAKHFTDYQFVVAAVNNLDEKMYKPAKEANIPLVFEQTYDLLSQAKAAVVTSGTASLETALFNVPQIVCYKANNITYQIVKRVVKVKYLSLVNLILEKEAVKELLQYDMNETQMKIELQAILTKQRTQILEDYKTLNQRIATEGVSQRAAMLMAEYKH